MQAKNEMEAIKALNEKVAGIVESGSNANGNWIQYADGTMIQYGSILNNANGLATVTLPKRFINSNVIVTTSISYNSYTSNNSVLTLVFTSNSSVGIYSRKSDGSVETNTTVKTNWQAIGRWK